ncbi:MAG: lysophospholipid acyltransferase family protein [Arcobacteraceae bacterium]
MKKKIFRYLEITLVPLLMQLIVRFIYLTNKKVYHTTAQMKEDENFIVCMWHGDLLMQPFNYQNFRPKGTVKAIISEHRDGEAIRKTVEYLGIGSLNGSSTRGGAKVLIGAIKSIKSGIDVAITPDGPKGPIYSIADGIVVISQKTNAKILPFSCVPSKYWQLSSWDKFVIPKPFGTLNFHIGDPIDVQNMEMDEAKALILDKMSENQVRK